MQEKEVPSLSLDFDNDEFFRRVDKIDEGSTEETRSKVDESTCSPQSEEEESGYDYDEGWVNAASFRDMKFESEEMNHLLQLEEYQEKEKIMKLDYSAEHLFPQWIVENKDWKSTQCKNNNNKISDILQTPHSQRSPEQTSTLIHWLMSVWQTAYVLGYKRCGQMFKVFHFLTYEPGQDIIVENERGLTFYIVISGTATVHKDGIGQVATINKGGSFGELALTEGNDVRSATVRAKTQVELLRLHKIDYEHFVKDIQLAERRENLSVLRECKIFDNWPRSKIQKMGSTCTRKTYKPGDVIFKQGEIPDSLYFIVDGKVGIYKEIMIIVRNRWPVGTNEWDGIAKKRIKPYLVNELQRGNFFGELSIIKNKRRTATAKAMTRCVLLCLDKLEFVHLLRSGKAMETVSNYSSKYNDDKEILNKLGVLNGGPSTTAQLNEYVKAVDDNHFDTKTNGDRHNSLLQHRPKTANARLRSTIVVKINEDDQLKYNAEESMKFSTPNRETRLASRVAKMSSPHDGNGGGTNCRQTLFNNGKLKNRGATLGADPKFPRQDDDDEEALKLKAKNENKAAALMADRLKSKLDPLKKSNQKQIKDSQLRNIMNEIILANRSVAFDKAP